MSVSFPRVSIVIPTYNAEKTIGPLLDSLMALDYPHYDVIVVNDGSKDNTRRVVETYPVRLVDQPNRGASAARDTGLRASSGDIVAYVDSDVTVDSDWLGNLVEPFSDHSIAATTGRTVFMRSDKCASWLRSLDIERRNSRRREFTLLANGPNCAFRRDILLQVGGFDPSWYHAEDTEVSYKIWQAGYRIKYVPEAVVNHVPEENARDFLRKRYRDARAFVRMLLRYPRFAGLKDDFVSFDMKVQPPLYAFLLLLVATTLISIGNPVFVRLAALLAIGHAVGLIFGMAEALPVVKKSGRLTFLPISIVLITLRGYAWAFGLFAGLISNVFHRDKRRSAPLALIRNTSNGPDSLHDDVLNFYDQFPCGGDEFTDDGRWSRLPWMKEEFEPEGRGGQIVLELGCGIGVDLQRFVENGATVVGIDFAAKPLEYARHRLDRGRSSEDWHLVRADARFLPFKSGVFDYFYSNGVLHHIANYERVLEEAHRCLKERRRGTVVVYHKWSLMTVLTIVARAMASNEKDGIRSPKRIGIDNVKATQAGWAEMLYHPLIQYFSPAVLDQKFHEAGFTAQRITAHDWSFPLFRRAGQRGSTALDRWFGRFLVAQIQKSSE